MLRKAKSPFLVDCFQNADFLPLPPTVLLAKAPAMLLTLKCRLRRSHMAGSIMRGRIYLPGPDRTASFNSIPPRHFIA
jgi:hypothetical protein